MRPRRYVKREGVSLEDATVALVSLDGAPQAQAKDFRDALARQFSAHGVVAAEAGKARYLLRVYLAASPEEGGASLDYVVDVYDTAACGGRGSAIPSRSRARATPGA